MKIIYWSETGNTERVAELIKQGIQAQGKNAELVQVSDVNVEDIKNKEVIIMGS